MTDHSDSRPPHQPDPVSGAARAWSAWEATSTSIERTKVSGRTLPCRVHPADLWFAEKPEEVEQAKALCGRCPLAQDCLAGALERGEPWGVWGGQLLVDGAVVARKRPRGRPRKNPVAA
ncbi:WhiB family transcriptional regulator [Ornithinicoccus halotolerans]|uniref:WhiB family transcriptional regulator n=1 Tax=Ornithinicoccus halotolerans TaxID=1748220 RepID=UPI0012971CAB|nr:WhiB family transcriptional regulator [Ornithinicoccus halotolerans]